MENMPAPSQTGVIWTIIVAAIALLVFGFIGINYLNTSLNTAVIDAEKTIDTRIDSAVGDLQNAANDLKNVKPQSLDNGILNDVCSNTDGCDGWRLSNTFRLQAVNRVIDEITEDDNRDLFRWLDDLYDIDEKEDVDSSNLETIGKVRSNEELDSNFDFSDSMEIYVEFVLEVNYFEDGNNDDTKKKFVRIEAKLTDLEDGIGDSEVKILNVESWKENKALESN